MYKQHYPPCIYCEQTYILNLIASDKKKNSSLVVSSVPTPRQRVLVYAVFAECRKQSVTTD